MKTVKLFRVGIWLMVSSTLLFRLVGQSVLTNGLIAYYPFNGNASDATGLRGGGIVSGATLVSDRFGVGSSAFGFSPGLDQKIELPSDGLPSGFEPMTISFWMKIENPKLPIGGGFSKYIPFNVVQSLSPVFAWDFNFVFQGNGIDFTPNVEVFRNNQFLGDYNLWSLFSSLESATNWHQIVLITHSNDFRIFLDGVYHAFTAVPRDLELFERPPGRWYIGGNGGSFSGRIDEFRIYDRALSDSEVRELYGLEAAPEVEAAKAVKIVFSGLIVGTWYQPQMSSDMKSWTNLGSAFKATDTVLVKYWDLATWAERFFRLRLSP